MSATGHTFSKNASVKITTIGGGSLVLTAHGNSVSTNEDVDQLEATAYGDTAHTFLDGLENFTMDFSGWWAGSHATDVSESAAACLHSIKGKGSTCQVMFWFSPAGSTAGSIAYAACVNISNLSQTWPADGIATMSFSFAARSGSMTACPDSIWT